MAKGNARIAEQIDNYGIFGSIELECYTTDHFHQIEIFIDERCIRWKSAIMFGASYFLEHIDCRVGLDIKVIDIDFHEVDTNNVVLSYLTIMALVAATGYSLKRNVLFDKRDKSFVFPK